jgi:hypothetical protein
MSIPAMLFRMELNDLAQSNRWQRWLTVPRTISANLSGMIAVGIAADNPHLPAK